MKIYTRTGDEGETSLFGGQRVSKTDLRIETYGTVDELNSCIGMARSLEPEKTIDDALHQIQNDLFVMGADFATPPNKESKIDRINQVHITRLEGYIDHYEESLPPLTNFILPGGSPAASALHIARTVCRRAERAAIHCSSQTPVNHDAIVYLNRLSDLLFVFTRAENAAKSIPENRWKVR
jgi:cob(I)alamin adenosyltransferase